MRGPKLVWLVTRPDVAEPGKALPLQVIDADTRAQVRVILIYGQGWRKFPHVAQLLPIACYVQAAWTVEVVPLVHVRTVGVEYLNSMVFAVCNVHVAMVISADAMNEVELSGIAAGLAPGKQKLPIR
jgi:hypothetical protein